MTLGWEVHDRFMTAILDQVYCSTTLQHQPKNFNMTIEISRLRSQYSQPRLKRMNIDMQLLRQAYSKPRLTLINTSMYALRAAYQPPRLNGMKLGK